MVEDYSKTIGIKAIVLHVEKINERAHPYCTEKDVNLAKEVYGEGGES